MNHRFAITNHADSHRITCAAQSAGYFDTHMGLGLHDSCMHRKHVRKFGHTASLVARPGIRMLYGGRVITGVAVTFRRRLGGPVLKVNVTEPTVRVTS
jgi:hypothetical protein